jgi:hypothetical protein
MVLFFDAPIVPAIPLVRRPEAAGGRFSVA